MRVSRVTMHFRPRRRPPNAVGAADWDCGQRQKAVFFGHKKLRR